MDEKRCPGSQPCRVPTISTISNIPSDPEYQTYLHRDEDEGRKRPYLTWLIDTVASWMSSLELNTPSTNEKSEANNTSDQPWNARDIRGVLHSRGTELPFKWFVYVYRRLSAPDVRKSASDSTGEPAG